MINLKGSLFGIITLVLLIVLSVIILLKCALSDNMYIPMLLICSIAAGMISGYTGTRKYRKSGLINGAVSAAIPAIVILAGIIFAEKGFTISDMIPSIVLIISGSIGGIAAVNIKRKTKKK